MAKSMKTQPSKSSLRCFSLLFIVASCGCRAAPINSSFAVTIQEARTDLGRMKETPRPLDRPLVIASGYGDPGLGPLLLDRLFRDLTGDGRIAKVAFPLWASMDECRRLLVEEVENRFPSPDPEQTVEVDVIGLSMGGVVTRYAASGLPPMDEASESVKRLRPKRLFTIGSPHLGATMASLPAITSKQRDLRRGSKFLVRLNSLAAEGPEAIGYEIIPYTRLGDEIVGEVNTAPPDLTPRWVSRPLFELGHTGAMTDARILADIARRLRNENPWSRDPPDPLPLEISPTVTSVSRQRER